MYFLPVDGWLGASLEQIGFDQGQGLQLILLGVGRAPTRLKPLSKQARDIVQHEADVGCGGHGRDSGVGEQLFVSMLIIIMHIILLDAVRKMD
ncbi:hypothetical protein OHD62_02490 [Mesorhizobium sp. YC-39]|uniref:hypothetical protein n=1 Tax=unclassified Mesorhizobium TaxID=325217 RepID=UPI0021E89C24|nr:MULTISPECIES: hypothetical protein [unclassified Mesorhizobium]MCV3206373.1 hypothetical protein [Mesorhizobium sp. YC-2]MCV3227227.1 hypothetical protein [Mesorhizobium sp. YC-39]